MKKMKIKTQLILSNCIVVGLALFIIIFSLLNIQNLGSKVNSLNTQTLPILNSILDIRRNIIIIERNLVEMVLSDDMTLVQDLAEQNQQAASNVVSLVEIIGKSDIKEDTEFAKTLTDYFAKMRDARTNVQNILLSQNGDWEYAYKMLKDDYFILSSDIRSQLMDYSDSVEQRTNNEVSSTEKRADIGFYIAIIFSAIFVITSIITVKNTVSDITVPLNKINNAAKALSNGDLNVKLDYNKDNEFGSVCTNLEKSFSELKRVIDEISNNFLELSEGNLNIEPSMTFPGALAEIESSELGLLNKLNNMFSNINNVSEQINSSSSQVANGSQALAQASTEQASSIEELSATLSDILAKVQANAEYAKKANVLATDSGVLAESAVSDMNELVNSIQIISKAAENIGKVIKAIDDIAFQTNILALNAAVEAARAGSAGKGFAVVADEVRNLAQKSSDAAHETTLLIEESIKAVFDGEKIADKTSSAVSTLVDTVKNVISTINDISKSSMEQTERINEIALGVNQISMVVQTNSATSQESAATSQELSQQVSVLNNMVRQFKLKS